MTVTFGFIGSLWCLLGKKKKKKGGVWEIYLFVLTTPPTVNEPFISGVTEAGNGNQVQRNVCVCVCVCVCV